MNLFTQGQYELVYFSPEHIHDLLIWIIIITVLLLIPYIFKGYEKGRYVTFLGYLMLFTKIGDSIYRIYLEKSPWYDTMPFHLCNASLVFAGIYYITKKRVFFNIVYFWFSGAILAVLLPGLGIYRTAFYPHVFMATHFFEIFAVLFGFIHLDERITYKGFKTAIIGYFGLISLSFVWNYIFKTNYMYTSDYIISAINFIKPFWLYLVLFIFLFTSSIVLMYLPFAFNQKDEFEEYEIEVK